MATLTYDPIASTTLTTSSTNVTFAGIPTDGTYRDLILVMNCKSLSSTRYWNITFNSDSTSSYNYAFADSGPTTSSAYAGTTTSLNIGAGFYSDGRNPEILQIFDYARTDKHKSMLLTSGIPTIPAVSDGRQRYCSARWANNSAITTIAISNSNSFAAGSTFSLYGIAA